MAERIPKVPPVILPVTNNVNRPLFSVMIPTYNCIRYLKYTLESVLCQDPGKDKMQIEVVDDCSTDGDLGALVKEIGKGRIAFYRQTENKGSLRNFETCINRAKGYYIHLLHGDDLVKKGFYAEIKSLFEHYPTIGCAISNFNWIDENDTESESAASPIMPITGIIENWLEKIASRQVVQPPAVVVKRSTYEQLGGFFAVHYGEDWEMWIRIASRFPVGFSTKCLATYRGGHTSNISTKSILSGENFKDLSTVIDIVQNYLPNSIRKRTKYLAKKHFSMVYAKYSYDLFIKDNLQKRNAFKIAKKTLQFNLNRRSIIWVCKLHLAYLKSLFTKYRNAKSM